MCSARRRNTSTVCFEFPTSRTGLYRSNTSSLCALYDIVRVAFRKSSPFIDFIDRGRNSIHKCIHFFGMANQKKITRKTLFQNYEKGGLKMIDIDKFIQAQKISWIKRLFAPNIKTTLKEVYTQRLSKFGNALLFECNFNENDI